MQSTVERQDGWHVAIIMDGNGRWATRRGLPRAAGHRAGVRALRQTLEAAPDAGISVLTVYAFSADNWRRPEAEVRLLMGLLRGYLRAEVARLIESGIKLTVIGRRDRLSPDIVEAITRAEQATAGGTELHLRIALDYSARAAILAAALKVAKSGDVSLDAISQALAGEAACADVDLVIRTSGEQRLSDFLLWECAYAELLFTDRLWPDFTRDDLASALAWFHARTRRFGGLAEVA